MIRLRHFTLADRELQHKVAMELYNMHEQLAKNVADISDKRGLLKDNMDKVKECEGEKQMQEYFDKLGAQGRTAANKDNFHFADENRLRERYHQVYSSICNTEAAPNNLQVEELNHCSKSK
jgi:hypothetical protein